MDFFIGKSGHCLSIAKLAVFVGPSFPLYAALHCTANQSSRHLQSYAYDSTWSSHLKYFQDHFRLTRMEPGPKENSSPQRWLINSLILYLRPTKKM